MAPPADLAPRWLGIDIGGTKIALGAVDDDGRIAREWRLTTGVGPEAAGCLDRLCDAVERARATYPTLEAIGVGICSQVDVATGRIAGADLTIPGWEALDPVDRLRRTGGLPVAADNDGNVAALGEGWVGAARGSRDYVLLTVGTGVGGGMVVDGRLVRGAWGGAGELGHLPLDPAGPPCNCGSVGCLEQLIAGPALDARARRLGHADARGLFAAAGNPAAARVVAEAGRYLGVAAVLLINVFQPERLLFGGGVMESAAPHWLPLVGDAVASGTFVSNRRTRLLPAALGNRAGVVGAAALARAATGRPARPRAGDPSMPGPAGPG